MDMVQVFEPDNATAFECMVHGNRRPAFAAIRQNCSWTPTPGVSGDGCDGTRLYLRITLSIRNIPGTIWIPRATCPDLLSSIPLSIGRTRSHSEPPGT